MKRLPVLVSFVLFIVLCISATYWAMQLFKSPVRAVAAPPQPMHLEIKLDAAAALFGGRPASVAAASNFQLKGVVVAIPEEDSIAILSTDGKPPQAIAMNAEVVPGVTVKEVHAKYVLLLDGAVTKRVELPEGGQQLQMESFNNQAAPNQAFQPSVPPMAAPPYPMQPIPQVGNPNGGFNPLTGQPMQPGQQIEPVQQMQPPQPSTPGGG